MLSRLLRRAKKVLAAEVVGRMGKEAFRTRNRSVRRVSQRLHRIARKKGEQAREQLQDAYRKLIEIAKRAVLRPGGLGRPCARVPSLGPKLWGSAWSTLWGL